MPFIKGLVALSQGLICTIECTWDSAKRLHRGVSSCQGWPFMRDSIVCQYLGTGAFMGWYVERTIVRGGLFL